MLAQWEVRYGPQFEESKQTCKMSKKALRLHLTALELHLERDPFLYSEAYTDENHRAMDTQDYFTDEDGRALTAFVTLFPNQMVAQIEWIIAGPLPSGEEILDEDDDEEV